MWVMMQNNEPIKCYLSYIQLCPPGCTPHDIAYNDPKCFLSLGNILLIQWNFVTNMWYFLNMWMELYMNWHWPYWMTQLGCQIDSNISWIWIRIGLYMRQIKVWVVWFLKLIKLCMLKDAFHPNCMLKYIMRWLRKFWCIYIFEVVIRQKIVYYSASLFG